MYALVTPARNEAERLKTLAASVLAQTLPPAAWVIVDDGSTDTTAAVAVALAQDRPWIKLVSSDRSRTALSEGRREGRALLSLQQGVLALGSPVELVVKLDADVTLPPDYFERIVAAFADDPQLGIASGSRCELERGRWRRRHLTASAVEAQCRTYRWACWEQVQPLEPRLGWDGIDEARAVLAGWTTAVLPGLEFRHHRRMGQRDGSVLRARAAEGMAAHFMAYRPSYLVLRALWNARREPAALAMIWGWCAAFARRRPRCSDPAARAYVRRQQTLRNLPRRFREARGHAV